MQKTHNLLFISNLTTSYTKKNNIAAFILLFFLLLTCQPVLANPKVNALKKELADLHQNQSDYKNKKADILLQLIDLELYSLPKDSLLNYVEMAAALFKELGNEDNYQKVSSQQKGLVLQKYGTPTEAIPYYQQYAEYISDKPALMNGYFFIDVGSIYFALNMYESANNYYQIALTVFDKEQNYDGIATTYTSLSLAAFYQRKFDVSAQLARKAFEARTHGSKDKFSLGYQHYLLGLALERTKYIEEAKTAYKKAIDYFDDKDFVSHIAFDELKECPSRSAIDLIVIYATQSKFDSADYYISIAQRLHKEYNLGFVNEVYFKESLMKYHQFKKNFKEAERIGLEIVKSVQDIPDYQAKQIEWNVLFLLSSVAKALGNLPKYYEYGFRSKEIKEKLQEDRSQDKMLAVNNLLLDMESKQKIQKQQLELKVQENEIQGAKDRQQVLIAITSIVSIILLLMAALWWILRKKNQQIAEYSKALEKTNATKELLISVLSHDLRSPFHTIMNSSQLAAENPKTADLLQINLMARNGFLMLDNLMQWVTLQKENLQLNKQSVEVSKITQELITSFKQAVLLYNIHVEQNLQVEWVVSDRNLLTVILRNLLGNALKNSPNNGKIMIATQLQNGQCLLSIKDEGKGFPQEIIDNFSTKNVPSKIAQKGGGLGLQLVRDFCLQLQISVRLYNDNQGGAVIELLLPIATDKINSNSIVKNTLTENKPNLAILQLAEKQEILPYLNKIKEFEIFESTEIYRELEALEQFKTAAVQTLVTQLKEAVYQSDAEKFNRLLDEALS